MGLPAEFKQELLHDVDELSQFEALFEHKDLENIKLKSAQGHWKKNVLKKGMEVEE
jgi:hypothetical protein